jgi:hypothetical protein
MVFNLNATQTAAKSDDPSTLSVRFSVKSPTTAGTNTSLDLVIPQQLHAQSAVEQVVTCGGEHQVDVLVSCFKNHEVNSLFFWFLLIELMCLSFNLPGAGRSDFAIGGPRES